MFTSTEKQKERDYVPTYHHRYVPRDDYKPVSLGPEQKGPTDPKKIEEGEN